MYQVFSFRVDNIFAKLRSDYPYNTLGNLLRYVTFARMVIRITHPFKLVFLGNFRRVAALDGHVDVKN